MSTEYDLAFPEGPDTTDYPAEPPDYVAELLAIVRVVLRDGLEGNRGELDAAADAVAELYESQDPRDMGWVGCDGRP